MERISKEQRSNIMRAIRSTNAKAEIRLAKALWNLGYRYRKNNKTVFGKPDLTFKKLKIAIFVDSEFFHGKDWETQKDRVKTNTEFWQKKIERNMQRDVEVNKYLESQNWKVLRFWSEQIEKNLEDCVTKIQSEIISRQNQKSEF
ncbi:MAG: very short patch repair endonuclease [Flavobacterium sp.]|jgi:DNA mismatch endonuclease (patch repair protein)|uniref:very short patch repair endonuclease n=1 Tax=Flavobacterium sp. TaxID=239 RepID=UPI0027354553|nr:very short patch repair endonuclease [Flavobacterium sp.]MDP3681746.1 very short patch repair endonuclease [Flavobacterium sp.]MDZ4331104.1 very short patch repair endonuclease [Flavobacterium sp.]